MTVSSEQIEDKITDFELFSQFWSVIMTYSYQNNFNIDVENKFWNRYSVPLTVNSETVSIIMRKLEKYKLRS